MTYAKLIGCATVAVIIVAVYFHEYNSSIMTYLSASFPLATRLIHNIYHMHGAGQSKDGISTVHSNKEKVDLFSSEELKQYGSSGNKGKLYLSILGQVFDVTKGKKHYGGGGGYSFFTGRDASRAYVTGDFTETGLTDDILNLSPQQLKGLKGWLDFYAKEYKYVGKLIGRYYDSLGHRTQYLKQAERMIKEAEMKERENDAEKIKYPPCNTEWSASKGSRVWCSNKSGGVSRDWIGVPRKLFVVGSSTPRCVCIRHPSEKQSEEPSLSDPKLEEYPGCHKDSKARMIRRNPTRIVLKLEDLQDYEVMRREQECKKQAITPQLQTMKTKQEIIHERIGYVPQQRQS